MFILLCILEYQVISSDLVYTLVNYKCKSFIELPPDEKRLFTDTLGTLAGVRSLEGVR